jgi:hypothetical protein
MTEKIERKKNSFFLLTVIDPESNFEATGITTILMRLYRTDGVRCELYPHINSSWKFQL